MVNIKKGGLKGERVRPQSIRPLIKFPRGILDQVISWRTHDGGVQRAPGPGLQVTSYKLPGPRPISNANKGLIHKRQASSAKLR